MKRKMVVVLMVCTLLCAATAFAELPDKVEMYYFYDELCGSCDGTEAFDAIAEEAMAGIRDMYPYEIYRVNVYSSAGKEQYRQICAEMGMDTQTFSLPLLVVGGRVFQGDETIARNMAEAFLVAGEDLFVNEMVYNPAQKKTGAALFEDYGVDGNAITVVYFYRITCEECRETTPVMDGLPQAVAGIPVNVIRINTRSGNNGERINAFFEQYAVPDEDRMVPIAFTADGYFAGYEAISEGLADALAAAEPGFVFPAGE